MVTVLFQRLSKEHPPSIAILDLLTRSLTHKTATIITAYVIQLFADFLPWCLLLLARDDHYCQCVALNSMRPTTTTIIIIIIIVATRGLQKVVHW
ncbi:hypothetical protein PoB_000121400 [Plakobranchus ocellatus]|uniref:G-protein coupled receptors family 1 profile domain-containing protein n=1 Tax=Plakobranchus ocellatus TaxID=259542 RepID=A0AAV3XY73_9GAST|nr:hypothetical protein PoB_000121400 [Plakobranchus ocellatus]